MNSIRRQSIAVVDLSQIGTFRKSSVPEGLCESLWSEDDLTDTYVVEFLEEVDDARGTESVVAVFCAGLEPANLRARAPLTEIAKVGTVWIADAHTTLTHSPSVA